MEEFRENTGRNGNRNCRLGKGLLGTQMKLNWTHHLCGITNKMGRKEIQGGYKEAEMENKVSRFAPGLHEFVAS